MINDWRSGQPKTPRRIFYKTPHFWTHQLVVHMYHDSTYSHPSITSQSCFSLAPIATNRLQKATRYPSQMEESSIVISMPCGDDHFGLTDIPIGPISLEATMKKRVMQGRHGGRTVKSIDSIQSKFFLGHRSDKQGLEPRASRLGTPQSLLLSN